MASGKRNWSFVAWVESSPEDWLDRLKELRVPCNCIVHDQDTDKDGTEKKAHIHGLLFFDGPVPFQYVLDMLKDKVFGEGINTVEPVASKYGSLLYLIHAKDPDKHQYKAAEVYSLNGADYVRDVVASDDPHRFYGEIKAFIDEYKITQFYDLSRIAQYFYPDWQRAVDYNALFWVKYLISKQNKQENKIYTEFDTLIEEITKRGN